MSRDELYEELSVLLDGQLEPERAAALRKRIESEPEVAAAWAVVRALPSALADLPDLAPPLELDRAVLASLDDGVQVAPISLGAAPRPWLAAIGWLAAAAAVAFAFVGGRAVDPPQLILADGSQWVDGAAMVYAGDQIVSVNGSARISVEPPRRDLRVVGVQTEDAVQKRDVLVGALAGAVVTVAVYEGVARIWPADGLEGAGLAVEAGQTRTVGIRQTPEGPKVERAPAPVGESAGEAIARLTRERDELARALEESRFEGAVARGQLAVHQGEPIPWDDSIPAGHRPEAIQQGIDSFLADHPEVRLYDLDCAEFPCIATFTPSGDVDPMDVARGLPKAYAGSVFGDDAAVMASVTAREGDDGVEANLISIAAVPEDRRDGDWATRAQYRTEAIADQVMDEAEDGSTQDVDIH